MKNKLFITISLGFLLVAPVVLAEEVVKEPVSANSQSTVLFGADDEKETEPGIVDPTDPTNPDGGGVIDPGENDGGTGTGTKSFNISWVSNFRFNDKEADGSFIPLPLNANGMNLWAKGTKIKFNDKDKNDVSTIRENIPNFIQVLDNRVTLSGWTLKVSGTPFKNTEEALELKGAQLSLNHPNLLGPSENNAPTAFTNKLIINDQSKPVMTAETNHGMGSWNLNFGEFNSNADKTLKADTGVNLSIPASASIKADAEYVSDLTWTLEDTPSK